MTNWGYLDLTAHGALIPSLGSRRGNGNGRNVHTDRRGCQGCNVPLPRCQSQSGAVTHTILIRIRKFALVGTREDKRQMCKGCAPVCMELQHCILRTCMSKRRVHVVLFRPGLASKPRLWLGLRRLRLSQTLGQAKAVNHGLALAWPGLGPGFYM
jgi:hypothetical protein